MNRSEHKIPLGIAALKAGLFTLCCVLALTAHADVSKQATWTIASGGNGHTYRVVESTDLISWDAANAAAQAAGGYLATITSAQENAFVFALIDDATYWTQSANGHGPWIGGYQLPNSAEPAGGFIWVLATGANSPEPFAYTNWEAGEPNNQTAVSGGVTYNADRVAFFHTGTGRAATWSDEYNQTGASLNQWTKSYVVELSPATPLFVNTVLTNGLFQLTFTNTPGVPFFVQASTNLAATNWPVISSAVETSSGHYQFTDLQTTNAPQRFYRVRSQ